MDEWYNALSMHIAGSQGYIDDISCPMLEEFWRHE